MNYLGAIPMNKERLQILIDVLKRAEARSDSLRMESWQLPGTNMIAFHEADLDECGSVCCVGGYLAVSDEFQSLGGFLHAGSGKPSFGAWNGSLAVAKFLETTETMGYLITGLDEVEDGVEYTAEDFYGESMRDLTLTRVISKLESLMTLPEGNYPAEAS